MCSFINRLPNEVLLEIFSQLDSRAILRADKVCKQWNEVLKNESPHQCIFDRERVFFGPEDWKKHFGDSGILPKISYKQAVKEALTFAREWPKEWDKKMVWFQPKEITRHEPGKEPEQVLITPRKIGELVAAKLGSECNPSGYCDPNSNSDMDDESEDEDLQKYLDTPIESSCWVYMTPDVLPFSRTDSYEEHMREVKKFGGEVPELVLAVTGIFLKRLVTGKRLFSDEERSGFGSAIPMTYTRCKEAKMLAWGIRQFKVGGFSKAGLHIGDGGFDCGDVGIAALWKFKTIN